MIATVAEKWWHDSYLSAPSFGDDPEIGTEQFQKCTKVSQYCLHNISITDT